MTAINLLTASGIGAGARQHETGFLVETPWGEYHFDSCEIPEGWYALETDAEGLVLCLRDRRRFNLIELHAARDVPGYVRLTAGHYDVWVIPGARPGLYDVATARFGSLSVIQRATLLSGRFFQALRNGVSLRRLIQLVGQAFSRRTYGLRAPGADNDCSLGVSLGVLTSNDLERHRSNREQGDFARRLSAMQAGPRFLIRRADGGQLPNDYGDAQVYPKYTLDASAEHDFVVNVAIEDRLTPDALLLMAEHIEHNPQTRILLADKWLGNRPTSLIAWDPLLYNGGLPTPFACASASKPAMTFENRSECAIVAVPLASTDQPDTINPHPVPALPPERMASIIIPTRDRADLLSACLEGLFDKTLWPHEVIVVDNGSVEPATFAIFETYAHKGLKVIRADIPFNFSKLCNIAAGAAVGNILVFLNNDVVVDDGGWLRQMVATALQAHIGAVGARLLYPDGTLQHAGIGLGLTTVCGHIWRGMPVNGRTGIPQLDFTSLRSAVTGACLCVETWKFEEVGGFDDSLLTVTLNDVDLCLKLAERGWLSAYVPTAGLVHAEMKSRGPDESADKRVRREKEVAAFIDRWSEKVLKDPFLSAALSLATERGALR